VHHIVDHIQGGKKTGHYPLLDRYKTFNVVLSDTFVAFSALTLLVGRHEEHPAE